LRATSTILKVPRRAGATLSALAGLAALAVLAAACPPAIAEPNGGYYPPRHGEERGNGASGAVSPLRWVDHSRQEFQRLMRLLAERSMGPSQSPTGMGPPPPPYARPRREPGWDWEPVPPPQPARWEPDDGDRHLRQREREHARYPAWPPQGARCRRAGVSLQDDGWYVVASGDTLWSIAQAHYGDGRAWTRIVEANRRRLPDPSCIYACQRLYIPYVAGREREWEDDERPAGDEERSWSRARSPGRPGRLVEDFVGSSPRGCTDCGAGSHVSVGNGNGRGEDRRQWR
jgi:nucleoid-associated protein YgaU